MVWYAFFLPALSCPAAHLGPQIFFATPHQKSTSWTKVVSRIFEEAPCFQFHNLKSNSRQLLDEEMDGEGLDQISREFASLSNDTMGLKLVSFEEETPMVSQAFVDYLNT